MKGPSNLLKKKQSEIIIDCKELNYSPLRRKISTHGANDQKSPLRNRTPNLSPMKKHLNNCQTYLISKSPKKESQILAGFMRTKSPIKKEINFEERLESLANNYISNNMDSRSNVSKGILNTTKIGQATSFLQLSNKTRNNQTEQSFRGDIKLFSKHISEKKKKQNDGSCNISVFEQSKINENNISSNSGVLKQFKQIQLIESVHGQQKNINIPFKRRQSSHGQNKPFSQNIEENLDHKNSNKKQKILQIINQSFAMPNCSNLQPQTTQQNCENINDNSLCILNKPKILNLQEIAKQLESIQIGSNYQEIHLLLQKINEFDRNGYKKEDQNMVKMSVDSAKDGLSMDPFL